MKPLTDFFEALAQLTLLRGPLMMKHVGRVDGTTRQLGHKAHSTTRRVSVIVDDLSRLDGRKIQVEQFLSRELSRHR